MLDNITSLAYSMSQNKGVYALLLGSGVSRDSGIPTGWEITLDLIRKVAAAEQSDVGADPIAWLKTTKGIDPDYSTLLDILAKTPSERRAVLSGYIEANEDERAEGRKQPTAAHHAIAELVRAGYVRVIITTNFDRLLENALRDAGVEPTVIATDDAITGAEPLTHARCTVVKVHGDYLDTRIRNTEPELASYGAALDLLLDRIFDEFGLIVSGWSATWDPALRDAISRMVSRRYSCYWVSRGELTRDADELVNGRKAYPIQCKSADAFFVELKDKVKTLEEMSKPHPLSAAMAVASVKRYVVDESARIKLNDLVEDSIADAIGRIPKDALAPNGPGTGDEIRRRCSSYEAALGILLPLCAAGARWSPRRPEQWVTVIERLLSLEESSGGQTLFLNLRRYPALLAFYAIGVAAVVGRNFELLKGLLYSSIPINGKQATLPSLMNTFSVAPKEAQQMLDGMKDRKYPFSDHFYDFFVGLLPRDVTAGDFERAFDTFELLVSLAYADKELGGIPSAEHFWCPTGRYAYKSHGVLQSTQEELERLGASWPWYEAGLFAKDQTRAQAIVKRLVEFTRRERF